MEGTYHGVPGLHLHVYASHRKRGVSHEVQPTLQHLAVSVRGMGNSRGKKRTWKESDARGGRLTLRLLLLLRQRDHQPRDCGLNEKNGTEKEE